jgi:hypothetical protein
MPSSDSARRPARRAANALLVAAGVLLVAGGVVVVAALRAPDEEGSAPVGTGDDFERADAEELGTAPGGVTWVAALGEWGIEDGAAQVVTPNPSGPRSIAVVDAGSGDVSVTVRAAGLGEGWGLVFRYHSPFAYWLVTASPSTDSLQVQRVDGAFLTPVADIGPVELVEGVELGVRAEGGTIVVLLDGEEVGTIADERHAANTFVGLVTSRSGAATARWDDLRIEATQPVAGPDDDG